MREGFIPCCMLSASPFVFFDYVNVSVFSSVVAPLAGQQAGWQTQRTGAILDVGMGARDSSAASAREREIVGVGGSWGDDDDAVELSTKGSLSWWFGVPAALLVVGEVGSG
jgi:hypothetical protein